MLLRTVTLSLSLSHGNHEKANNLHVLFPCDRTIFYLPRNVETNGIFHRTRTKLFFLCMETQGPQIAKTILRKKNRAAGIKLPDLIYTAKL